MNMIEVAKESIRTYSYVDDNADICVKKMKIDGDEFTVPNAYNEGHGLLIFDQVILTKEIFQQLYKEWILDDAEFQSEV